MERISRSEKCKIAIKKGYTYNEFTGFIYGIKRNPITRILDGYVVISLCINGKYHNLYGHQFAWYFKYKEVVVEIDHKNGIRHDNRVTNIRSVTHHQNCFNNTVAKGYCFDKSRNKWLAVIKLNKKANNLGRFNTESEARNAYLEAKKKYHKI